MNLSITNLLNAYRSEQLTPEQVVEYVLQRCEAYLEHNIWITRLTGEQIQPYLDALQGQSPATLPLYGIPFAIKDNIDLAGIDTTCACPEYRYDARQHAFVVEQLIQAGAIPIGKTNMDQFATGLVGTRSPEPWGPCRNAFNKDYISGGSSSGSAVAVATGLVSFALGTDTAGSGRVPAMNNNLVGLKPSKGLLSTRGVVPACRSLDCVSIFALNSDDANAVFEQAAVYDVDDDYARPNIFSNNQRHYGVQHNSFRFAVPRDEQLEFFGNDAARELFAQSCQRLEQMGGVKQAIDFAPFLDAARLLYEGPWVTERYVAIAELINVQPEALLPVINTIIGSGKNKLASDAYQAFYRLQHFKKQTDAIMAEFDLLVTPTAGTIYTIDAVNADPIQLNSNIGYYTNYMNLLDYMAVAVPVGFMRNGLPFGISLVGTACSDRKMLSFARQWQAEMNLPMGATETRYVAQPLTSPRWQPDYVDLVVCGAHLTDFPLNWQLTERGGALLQKTTTADCYRLFALPGDGVKRPGLFRDEQDGTAIDVEVWRLPMSTFGSFVVDIPAPLGIGKVELNSGEWRSGFICEPHVMAQAEEISHLGGWREYHHQQATE